MNDLKFTDDENTIKWDAIAQAGRKLDLQKSDPRLITGFLVDARWRVAATFEGLRGDFHKVTPKQLQDFARRHGGSELILYAKARTRREAVELIQSHGELNRQNLVSEMMVETEDGHLISARKYLHMRKVTNRFFGGSNGAIGKAIQESAADRGKIIGSSSQGEGQGRPH